MCRRRVGNCFFQLQGRIFRCEVSSSAVGGKAGNQPQHRNCDYLPMEVRTPFEFSSSYRAAWLAGSLNFHQVASHLIFKLGSFTTLVPRHASSSIPPFITPNKLHPPPSPTLSLSPNLLPSSPSLSFTNPSPKTACPDRNAQNNLPRKPLFLSLSVLAIRYTK